MGMPAEQFLSQSFLGFCTKPKADAVFLRSLLKDVAVLMTCCHKPAVLKNCSAVPPLCFEAPLIMCMWAKSMGNVWKRDCLTSHWLNNRQKWCHAHTKYIPLYSSSYKATWFSETGDKAFVSRNYVMMLLQLYARNNRVGHIMWTLAIW